MKIKFRRIITVFTIILTLSMSTSIVNASAKELPSSNTDKKTDVYSTDVKRVLEETRKQKAAALKLDSVVSLINGNMVYFTYDSNGNRVQEEDGVNVNEFLSQVLMNF